MSEVLTRI